MEGWLIAANVSPLYFLLIPLKKSDNLEQGNLISKTDAFINNIESSKLKIKRCHNWWLEDVSFLLVDHL